MLTEGQISSYHQDGYLKIDTFFSETEVEILRDEIDLLSGESSPRHIYEENGVLRSILGPHQISGRIDRLVRLDKIVQPAVQLLGNHDVYLHQTKINHKLALRGDRWDWHQDLYYWHKEDGFPGSGAISVGIFLDDVDATNGPLMLIPGSHREGMVNLGLHQAYRSGASWEAGFSTALKYEVDPPTLNRLLDGRKIVQATGRAGFVLFFHDLVFHGSYANMSGRDRTVLYLTYNRMDNVPDTVASPRPEFAASRNFEPVLDLVTQWT